MILGSLKKSNKRILEDLKPREQDTRRTSGNTTRIDPFPPSLILEAQTQIDLFGIDLPVRVTSYHWDEHSEHSSVTYASVPSLVEDYSDIGSPEVDGPPSPDYVPGLEEPEQAPPSPDYVPGPKEPEQALLSPDYVPGLEEPKQEPLSPDYVPGMEEPEAGTTLTCLLTLCTGAGVPGPLPVAATPTSNSPGYILEFDLNGDLEEDDEEDPEEDPADYHADSTVVALPDVDHVPSEERLHFASPTPSQEVGESSLAGAARQDEPAVAMDDPYSLVREELYGFVDSVDVDPRRSMSGELDYGITDTWDELVGANEEIAPTTLQGVNQRVTDLSTIVEQETTIMYGMMEDAQDNRSQLRGRVNLLYRDRPVHHRLAVMIERERLGWLVRLGDYP
nr:hypothetical protein [Tanacetum cinerariifolium]